MAVTARSLENYQVEINAGIHTYNADEPISAGGDDTAPNPYDLLLGGLAACKIITVQMYAKRKGWQVDSIELTLSHGKIDAADCEDCDSEKGKVDEIKAEISFKGDLTPEQIARLGEISNRCPVHRTLSSETKIRTTIKA
jgi:putative redox protein